MQVINVMIQSVFASILFASYQENAKAGYFLFGLLLSVWAILQEVFSKSEKK